MFEINSYSVTFPIEEFSVIANSLEYWVKNPTEYRVILVEDSNMKMYSSQEPVNVPGKNLSIYFREIQVMWHCSLVEITAMIEHTQECLLTTKRNTIAWRLNDNGVVLSEFDYPTSEILN